MWTAESFLFLERVVIYKGADGPMDHRRMNCGGCSFELSETREEVRENVGGRRRGWWWFVVVGGREEMDTTRPLRSGTAL